MANNTKQPLPEEGFATYLLEFGALARAGRLEEIVIRLRAGMVQEIAPAFGAPGAMYLTGTGVVPNPPYALQLFRQGARRGDPDACALIGECLVTGEGSEVDIAEAVRWFLRAAISGSCYAQCVARERLAWLHAEHGEHLTRMLTPAEWRYLLEIVQTESARQAARPSSERPP